MAARRFPRGLLYAPKAAPRCRFVFGAKLARRKSAHLQYAPDAGRIGPGTSGVATDEIGKQNLH